MSKEDESLPTIYLLQQGNQRFDQAILNALSEAGFQDPVILGNRELIDELGKDRGLEQPCCFLINPTGEMILDPWNEVWDLKNHFIIPVLIIGDEFDDSQSEYFSRLSMMYSVIKKPYDPVFVRQTILDVTRDFTDAATLYSSSPWLTNVINSVNDGILIIDTEHRIRVANTTASRLLEYSLIELYNSNLDDVLVPENILSSTPQSSGMGVLELAELKQKSGSRFQAQIHQNSIYDSRMRPVGSMIVIQDERSKVQFAASIREASQQEELHARARSEFISNMSHELRTPLNSILGMADLAMELADNEEQKEFLSLLKSSTRNLSTLVTTILDYSKLEARNLTLEYERFHLHSLIEQSLDALISRGQGKNLRVYLDIQPGMRSIYRGDKGRIAQILENLFQNAVKFTRSGYISCSISEIEAPNATTLTEIREPVELILTVEDSGTGIEAEHIDRIFEPFYQIDASATRNFGGTGLGLSISRQLAVRMGGDITVESEVDRGSKFTASIIVNREESDLLYINKKLNVPRVVSDQIPAELRRLFAGFCMYFVSGDELWSRNIENWFDFIGISRRRLSSRKEYTRVAPEERLRGIFIYDIRHPWVQELGAIRNAGSETRESFLHLIARYRNISLNSWLGPGREIREVADPLSITEILGMAMTHMASRESGVDEGFTSADLQTCYIFAGRDSGGRIPPLIISLADKLGKQGIGVETHTDFNVLAAHQPAMADLLIAFDKSFSPWGVVDMGRDSGEFERSVQLFRENSGHKSPVLAFLDAAVPAEDLRLREELYRNAGMYAVSVFDYSADALYSFVRTIGPGLASGSSEYHGERYSELNTRVAEILQRVGEQNFDKVQKLARDFQLYCKERELMQFSNDSFRIYLAARRSDSETIYDILNNIRKDIENNRY